MAIFVLYCRLFSPVPWRSGETVAVVCCCCFLVAIFSC